MAGRSHPGPLPPLTAAQAEIRDRLHAHIQELAGKIRERNTRRPRALEQAAQYIQQDLQRLGYQPQLQTYESDRQQVSNIEIEKRGIERPDEIVVIGAHYDTVSGTPGANDNGTGVGAVLELARMARETAFTRTLRLLFFVNEEPPFFQTQQMGSLQYAQRCRDRREDIVAMLSLETIGYYSDEPNSQQYPSGLSGAFPDRGDFVAFVANFASEPLLHSVLAAFRKHVDFPAIGAAVPTDIPGVAWSDQWAFWENEYPAIMLTDTAPFRYRHYHAPSDTPEKVNYDRTARVVDGVWGITKTLARLR